MNERTVAQPQTAAVPTVMPVRGGVLQRRSTNRDRIATVPLIVHEVLRSPGRPLDSATRTFVESRFGHDFSRVRVHTGARAAESARTVNAQAYTVGRDIVFGAGEYAPVSGPANRLLAHELAHVVQQERAGSDARIEDQAEAAAARVAEGYSVPGGFIGGAQARFCRQVKEEEKKPRKKAGGEIKLDVPPEKIAPKPALVPPTPAAKGEPKEPEMPSRVPIPWLNKGRFSLGLRLGFPESPEGTELQKKLFSDAPEPIKESLQRAKIIDQTLTGKVPTGWEETDKGKLAKAMWGIFSKNIAPGVARKITSGLSASTGAGGLSYELDLVLITDFSKEIGGGASFALRW